MLAPVIGEFVNIPPGSGGAPSGPAGGDLAGTYPNPSVAKAPPAMASWKYVTGNGTPDEGFFTANTDNRGSISSLKISGYSVAAVTGTDFGNLFTPPDFFKDWIVWLTGPDGITVAYPVTASVFLAEVLTLTLGAQLGTAIGNFSGVTQILFTPQIAQLPSVAYVDSGDAAALAAAKSYVDGLAGNYDVAGAAAAAQAAAQSFATSAIAAMLADPGTLSAILTAAGVTPVADGTVTPVTSQTTKTGITTALS